MLTIGRDEQEVRSEGMATGQPARGRAGPVRLTGARSGSSRDVSEYPPESVPPVCAVPPNRPPRRRTPCHDRLLACRSTSSTAPTSCSAPCRRGRGPLRLQPSTFAVDRRRSSVTAEIRRFVPLARALCSTGPAFSIGKHGSRGAASRTTGAVVKPTIWKVHAWPSPSVLTEAVVGINDADDLSARGAAGRPPISTVQPTELSSRASRWRHRAKSNRAEAEARKSQHLVSSPVTGDDPSVVSLR
jgi:hypothetical protein